ncbi:MAG: hypothetical protein KGJ07_00560 [Patescibacteria group bacterium]|nr:hypothetical protein [Patescibacteria group bacterium]
MGNNYRAYFSITREQMERFSLKYPDANLNTIAKQIFLENLDGKVQSNTIKNIDNQIKEQKLVNMRKDAALKDLTIWKAYKENGKPLSLEELIEISQGKKDTQALLFSGSSSNSPIPKPEPKTPVWIKEFHRLACWQCDPRHVFEYEENDKADMCKAVDEFTDHISKTHNRSLNELERKQILEFLNEVDKIAA